MYSKKALRRKTAIAIAAATIMLIIAIWSFAFLPASDSALAAVPSPVNSVASASDEVRITKDAFKSNQSLFREDNLESYYTSFTGTRYVGNSHSYASYIPMQKTKVDGKYTYRGNTGTISSGYTAGGIVFPEFSSATQIENIVNVCGTAFTIISGSVPYTPDSTPMDLSCTFKMSTELKKALKDNMLIVSVTPYVVVAGGSDVKAQMSGNNLSDSESCMLYSVVYNGRSDGDDGDAIRNSSSTTIDLKVDNQDTLQIGKTTVLDSGNYESGAFIQVTMCNFRMVGTAFTVAIREIGVRVTVTYNQTVNIVTSPGTGLPSSSPDDVGKVTTCIVQGLNRYHAAPSTSAKPGDVLDINLILKRDSKQMVIDTRHYGSAAEIDALDVGAVKDGTMFRRLFLNMDDYLITWDVTAGTVVQGSAVSDVNDKSGQAIKYEVESGSEKAEQKNLLVLQPSVAYRSIVEKTKDANGEFTCTLSNEYHKISRANIAISVTVDAFAPNAPEISNEGTGGEFYRKYLKEDSAQYYTSIQANPDEEDKIQEELVRLLVTGATNRTRPTFTADTTDNQGGSDSIIYYRTVYIGDEIPISPAAKNSVSFTGPVFKPTNAALDGFDEYEGKLSMSDKYYKLVYYSATIGGSVPAGIAFYYRNSYGKYVKYTQSTFAAGYNYYTAELYEYETCGEFTGVYARVAGNGREMDCEYGDIYLNMVVRNDRGVNEIKKAGVWAIEFVSYDYTGKRTMSDSRYFINVDITEYEFVVLYAIGNDFEQTDLQKNQVELSAATVSDDGVKSQYKKFTPSADGNNNVFHFIRANKIAIRVKLDSSTANNYTMTKCTVGNISFDTGSYTYTNRQTDLDYLFLNYETSNGTIQRAYYTFEIGELFCNDPTKRKIELTFKKNVKIEVSNTQQYFDGNGKSVITTIPTLQAMGMAATVTTKYYTQPIFEDEYLVRYGDSGSNFPVDAGTYYYFCELVNHNTYYGNSLIDAADPLRCTLVILKATPSIATAGSAGLNYGESFSKIDYDPNKRVGNVQMPNSGIYAYFADNRTGREYFIERLSSDLIVGYYEIVSVSTPTGSKISDKQSKYYTNPSAGNVTVTIRFVPVKGAFVSYSEINYEYDARGNFQRDPNYETVIGEITVRVSHDSSVTFAVNQNQENGAGRVQQTTMETQTSTATLNYVEYTYNGQVRDIAITVVSSKETDPQDPRSMLNLRSFARLSYVGVSSLTLSQRELSMLTYGDQKPSESGIYAVRIRLDETQCNYSFTTYSYIVINKVLLTVGIAQGNATFDYQQEAKPILDVKRGTTDYYDVVRGYKYDFFYYLENATGYAEMATEENAVRPEDLRSLTYTPYKAGRYCLRVTVDDNNYSGMAYVTYTVKSVDSDNTRLTKNWPDVSTSASDVAAINNIMYGQPLNEVLIGSAMSFTYPYVNYRTAVASTTTIRTLNGIVFIAYVKYEDWLEEQSDSTDNAENRRRYEKEMRNYCPQYSETPYGMFKCLSVRDETGTEYDWNYDFIYTDFNLRVGKAIIDWTRVGVRAVTYGDVIKNVGFADRNDLKIEPNFGVMYSTLGNTPEEADGWYTTGNGRNVYRIVSGVAQDVEFLEVPSGFLAGSVNVNLRVNFSDDNYQASYVGTVTMKVEKKNVTVSVKENPQVYYNAFSETDLNGFLEYRKTDFIRSEQPDNLIGEFKFFKDGAEVELEEFGDINAGAYTVVFELNHNNYSAEVEFTLNVEKSRLTAVAEQAPALGNPDKNIVYNAPIEKSTVFLGGRFVADGGETLSVADDDGAVVLKPTMKVGSGYFTVNSESRFTNAGTAIRLYYVFEPKDANNYELFTGTDENGGYIDVTVGKADISEEMTVEMKREEYIYKDIYYSRNEFKSLLNYGVSEQFKSLYWAATVANERGEIIDTERYLNAGRYTVSAIIDDANYSGTATCELTVGKKPAYIRLREADGGQIIEENGKQGILKSYKGSSPSFDYQVFEKTNGALTPIEDAATLRYYRNGSLLFTTPSNIGFYDVVMTLDSSINYELYDLNSDRKSAGYETFIKIGVDISTIEVMNLEQTFLIQKVVTVSMGINDAVCVLSYKREDETDASGSPVESEIMNMMPVEAGTYAVFLNFRAEDNNGYAAVINAADITDMNGVKREYKLVIEKAYTQVNAPNSVSCTYTGAPVERFSPYTSPYGLALKYEYRLYGTTDEFVCMSATTEEGTGKVLYSALANLGAIDAGTYEVRISIDTNNYRGEKVLLFTVNKARLNIKNKPVFSDYEYNSDTEPVYNTGTGEAVFGSEPVSGSFRIPLANIKRLNAGEHTVSFVFEADSKNFAEATDSVKLTVVKQTLPQGFIRLGENGGLLLSADYSVEYNGTRQNIPVVFDESRIYGYPSENADFNIVVRYYIDGIEVSPMQRGQYTLVASVSSRNYTCEQTWDYKYIVTKGTPIVRETPKANKSFVINDWVYDSDFMGGRAEVSSTGAEIKGRFVLDGGQVKLTKANGVRLPMKFYPTDGENYNETELYVTVSVTGTDPVKINGVTVAGGSTSSVEIWNDVVFFPDFVPVGEEALIPSSAHSDCGARLVVYPKNGNASLQYGATANEFYIGVVASHDDCEVCNKAYRRLAENGTIGFENLNDVPDAGSRVYISYKIAPSLVRDSDILNYMYAYYSLENVLLKKQLTEDEYDFEVIKLSDDGADYVFKVNTKNGEVFADISVIDNVKTSGGAFARAAVEELNVTVTFDGVTGKASIGGSTLNYVIPDSTVNVQNYIYVHSDDIIIGNYSKPYDTRPITAADLDISIRNTQLPVTNDAYAIIVYDGDGRVIDGIYMGDYRVTVYIEGKKNGYYGSKELVFSITRRDISDEMVPTKASETIAGQTVYYDTYEMGSHTSFAFEVAGRPILSSACKIEIKSADKSDLYYTPHIDSLGAGTYNIRVTVDARDYWGVSVFTYKVLPHNITMITPSASYAVDYGSSEQAAFSPTVSFTDAFGNAFNFEDKGGYKVSYYSSTYPKQESKPQNAGVYTVNIESDNANYFIVNGTVGYTVRQRTTRMERVPTPIAIDAEGNNLIYGQNVGSLILKTDEAVVYDSLGNEISGTYAVVLAGTSLTAGAHAVTVEFTPFNGNYARCQSQTAVTVRVAKKTVRLELTNTTAAYTGTSRASELTFKQISEPIDIEFKFFNASGQAVDPVSAGVYTVSVGVADPNYKVILSQPDGTVAGNPYFIVSLAQPRKDLIRHPVASSVGVGVSLSKSSLDGERIYYEGFSQPIKGSCSFVEEGRVFTDAGTKTVEYVFTPSDYNNFASYRGTVEIVIGRGIAKLTVGENQIEYGTPADFTRLNITTTPSGLQGSVKYDFTFEGVQYKNGDIMPAGTYRFTCWVDGRDYYSEYEALTYVVTKKEIDIDFVDENGSAISAYSVMYGEQIEKNVKAYDANTYGKRTYLPSDADTVLSNLEFRYVSRGETDPYDGYREPTAIGSYDMTVTLKHDNYTASRTIILRITTGRVSDISFELNSLINQIYGEVSAPIINTVPTDIKYYVIYQGYGTRMPTAVGSYNITVYVDDPNYASAQMSAVFKINPKPLSVSDLFVSDKAYDGNSTLKINGSLVGVRYGDEVNLQLEARTYGGECNVGEHYVEITKCELSGLNAASYVLAYPTYNERVNIYDNLIKDSGSGTSYITSSQGFASGTTVTFGPVDTPRNKTDIWSKMVGVEAVVTSYKISVNNVDGINATQYKVCVEIPEQFRGKDFKVSFDGALKDLPISSTVEGNYVSFYSTTASGEVVFESAEFKYTYVVIAAVLVIILLAVAVMFIVNPLMSRRNVSNPKAEKAAIRKIKKGQ